MLGPRLSPFSRVHWWLVFLVAAHGTLVRGCTRNKVVLIAVVALVSAAVYLVALNMAIAIAYPADTTTGAFTVAMRETLKPDCAVGWLLTAVALFIVCLVAQISCSRYAAGKWNRGMRAVFQRWLLLLVSVVFICTMAFTYGFETMRLQRSADQQLGGEISYVDLQIDDYQSKLNQLTELESQSILDKADTAAGILELSPNAISSTESIASLADLLNLSSLTVVDADGIVVADSDGQGVGIYDFFTNSTTEVYKSLVDGTQGSLVEQPRASVGLEGVKDGEYLLFAGVTRTDAPGFVQVSIPASSYEAALSAASLEHLGDDYYIGQSGGIVVIQDGIVVTSTDKEMRGQDVTGYLDIDAEGYEDDSLGTIVDSDTGELFFARFDTYDSFQIMIYQPVSEVYSNRDFIMAWSTLFYLVLFTAVFLLARRLLDVVVIDGIAKTNSTLSRITNGDLNQKVEVRSNTEFDSLSTGINTTVDALKGSIAEAAARIDRELATARAIQSSALPAPSRPSRRLRTSTYSLP